MRLCLLPDEWMFCTNGYPDPDAVRAALRLIMVNAQQGVGVWESPAVISGYTGLYEMCALELVWMGDAL